MTDKKDDPLILYKSREEWLADRPRWLGASEVSSLLGYGYQTPLQLWMLKTGRQEPARSPQEERRLRIGTLLEQEALGGAKSLLGAFGTVQGGFRPHKLTAPKIHPRLAVTLDAQIFPAHDEALPFYDPERGFPPVELKTVSNYMADQWPEDVPQPHAEIQAAVCALVLEVEVAHVYALFGYGESERSYTIPVDPRFSEVVAEKIDGFWRMVDSDTPPEPTYMDGKALAALYRKPTGRVIFLPAGTASLLDQREQILREASELEKRKDEIDAKIKAGIGTASAGVISGTDRIARWQLVPAKMIERSEHRRLTIGKAKAEELSKAEEEHRE